MSADQVDLMVAQWAEREAGLDVSALEVVGCPAANGCDDDGCRTEVEPPAQLDQPHSSEFAETKTYSRSSTSSSAG